MIPLGTPGIALQLDLRKPHFTFHITRNIINLNNKENKSNIDKHLRLQRQRLCQLVECPDANSHVLDGVGVPYTNIFYAKMPAELLFRLIWKSEVDIHFILVYVTLILCCFFFFILFGNDTLVVWLQWVLLGDFFFEISEIGYTVLLISNRLLNTLIIDPSGLPLLIYFSTIQNLQQQRILLIYIYPSY